MAVGIERPASEAEIAMVQALSSEPHPFPSGHVAGTAALLGIVAVGIGARGSGALRGALVSCVVAGTLIVAFSRLVLGAHWLSDVVGERYWRGSSSPSAPLYSVPRLEPGPEPIGDGRPHAEM